MPDTPSYQRFIVGTEDAIPVQDKPPEDNPHETEHEKLFPRNDGVSRASCRGMDRHRHCLYGGHGMWQQNAAPLTSLNNRVSVVENP